MDKRPDDLLIQIEIDTERKIRLAQEAFRQVVGQFPPYTDIEKIRLSEIFKKCYRELESREVRFETISGIEMARYPVVTESGGK